MGRLPSGPHRHHTRQRHAPHPYCGGGAEKVALARSRFVDIAFDEYHWERPVDIDTILGELFSTSFANKALLGEQADAFESDLRRSLLALEPSGRFVQHLHTEYNFAYKR